MKKLAKGILIILLFILLLFLVYVLVTFPPIMGGMAAKTLSSCIFVSERTPESVIRKELQVFPGLDKLEFEINRKDSSVTARLLWQKSRNQFSNWAISAMWQFLSLHEKCALESCAALTSGYTNETDTGKP